MNNLNVMGSNWMSPIFDKRMDWIDNFFTSSINSFHKQFSSFLPYDFYINRKDGTAHFSISVSGFNVNDLEVTYTDGMLIVKNKPQEKEHNADIEYVHKGIAARLFEFSLPINPLYEVVDAKLKSGILKINFKKVQSEKSTKVEIKAE